MNGNDLGLAAFESVSETRSGCIALPKGRGGGDSE